MNAGEAAIVIGRLEALFAGRISEPTLKAWALELVQFGYAEAMEGAREHARQHEHPSLKGLIECIELARSARATKARQRLDRTALPANATPDPEQVERNLAAMKACIDQVLRRTRTESNQSDKSAETGNQGAGE